MGLLERLRHLLQLPGALLGAEVDRRAHSARTEVERLLRRPEHHLVGLVRVRQQLVVVHLDDERDAVRVLARLTAPSTPKVVATALQPPSIASSTMLAGSKYMRVGRERRRRRVLDALVDRQDRHVAGVGQAAVTVELAEVAQHLPASDPTVRRTVEEVRAGQHQLLDAVTPTHWCFSRDSASSPSRVDTSTKLLDVVYDPCGSASPGDDAAR